MIATLDRLGFNRNVSIFIACQALGMSSTTLTMTLAALAGASLADRPIYATFPIALQFLATLLGTVPAAYSNRWLGRRLGGLLGIFLGVLGGAVASWGLFRADFVIFSAGCFVYGLHNAFIQQYRFGAAEAARPDAKARVISYVMLGGIVAALVGPTLAKTTVDLFPSAPYAGAYACIVIISLIAFTVMTQLDPSTFQTAEADNNPEPVRPLSEIFSQPKAIVAVLSATIGYGAMNFIMIATPLSMRAVGCTLDQSANVIMAHILGMFVPSFFTGSLINRFGAGRVIIAGLLCTTACIVINGFGTSMAHFYTALVLLGIGWNFMFVGGTSLLTSCYRPSERAKVQAVNDFIVFGLVAITAMMSGVVFATGGWFIVNIVVIPFLYIVLAVYLWLLYQGWRSGKGAAPTSVA